MDTSETWRREPVAVLVSGGPDSAVLVGELARTSPRVVPVYVRFGLVWEEAEIHSLRCFLAALAAPSVEALQVFEQPGKPLYGSHWSTTGADVPDADSPDAAVYLPGRNLLLALPAAVWCRLNDVPTVALGLLKGNPFPDSSDAFFAAFETALGLGLDGGPRLVRPYAGLTKDEVLRRGREMPLGLTWSCMSPVGGRQCGRCNKCAERRRAFARAGVEDTTEYERG